MAVYRPDPKPAVPPLSHGAAGGTGGTGGTCDAGCNKCAKVKAGKRCGLLKGIKLFSEVANPVHSVETFARLL